MRLIIFTLLLILAIQTVHADTSIVTGEEIRELTKVSDSTTFDYTAPEGYYIEGVAITTPNEAANVTVILYGVENQIKIVYSTQPFSSYEKYDLKVYENGALVYSKTFDTWLGKLFEDYIKFDFNYNGMIISTNVNTIYAENVSVFKRDPIRSLKVTSTKPATIAVYGLTDTRHFTEEPQGGTRQDPWLYLSKAIEIITAGFSIITLIFYYFKLLLIDNGVLVFAVWESLVLLYASATSSNIITFYRRVINAHRSLIEFIIQVIRWLIQIFTSIVQAIGSIIPFT